MDNQAIEIVRGYILEHLDKSDQIPEVEVYTVWKCKALQNWKYLISSTLPDGGMNIIENGYINFNSK